MAGADTRDLEFYQFHPTCLSLPKAPPFLVSEALRGEGGTLRNADGNAFMLKYDERGDLAPRDIVARAIRAELRKSGTEHSFLDMTHLRQRFLEGRFPTIFRVCAEAGLDISTNPIPVSPAAHYACGGVKVDSWGTTSLARVCLLWVRWRAQDCMVRIAWRAILFLKRRCMLRD